MKIKETPGEKAFKWFNYTFMTLLNLVFILPFLSIVATSFLSAEEAARRGTFVLWPEHFDFTAYQAFLSKGSVLWQAYGVTIFVIVVGTALNLLFTSTLAYGLSKKFLPGRNLCITLIFISMIFSGGLLPSYLLVKSLKLINTIWALIIPGLIGTWNFIVMKAFFTQLPQSLEESAMIDGASPMRIMGSIILPISMPLIATMALFYAVGHWNAWFGAAIYIYKKELYPVQIILRNTVLMDTMQDINNNFMHDLGASKPTPTAIKSACIIITTVPMLCIYPFIQKHFVKGVMVGSIKG